MVLMSEFGDKKTILKLELRHISPRPREVLVVVEERPVPAVSVAAAVIRMTTYRNKQYTS